MHPECCAHRSVVHVFEQNAGSFDQGSMWSFCVITLLRGVQQYRWLGCLVRTHVNPVPSILEQMHAVAESSDALLVAASPPGHIVRERKQIVGCRPLHSGKPALQS